MKIKEDMNACSWGSKITSKSTSGQQNPQTLVPHKNDYTVN
jgi:hypothetical protein